MTRPHPRLALAIIASATLMIVLDASIINIALPRAQADLGLSDITRPWIITAYALTFGGCLLIGGRIGDIFGHRRMFLLGLGGFAMASAVGGVATTGTALIAARALQGLFGAVLAPAALALLTMAFRAPAERARAFAVYGAVQGMGGAAGLLLGGVLTEYLSWRWCFFINIPIALAVFLAASRALAVDPEAKERGIDLTGAVLSLIGLVAVVYGLTTAGEGGAAVVPPLLAIMAGLICLAAFLWWQGMTHAPLLRLSILTERVRATAFLSLLCIGAGMFGMLMFLAIYLQGVAGLSPLGTGLTFLPFSVGIILGSSLAARLMPRVGDVRTMRIGLAGATLGMVWLVQVGASPDLTLHLVPALCLMSLGLGTFFVPSSSAALQSLRAEDTGVASALVNVTQQVGGAIGPAVLNTVFLLTAGTADTITSYRAAFATAAMLFGLALLVAFVLPRPARKGTPSQELDT